MKLFFMAALALMTVACSNDENDAAQQPQKAEGILFTATITVDKGATTRALAESGNDIVATWAEGEKVALIYNVGAKTYVKEAEVTPQAGGTATISATLDGSPADDTDVTIVYPASAVDATTNDVKANLLATQNGLLIGEGSISEKYDLRKTTSPAKLKIDGTTASLKGTVSLTNQNAIFKLTLKDIDGTNDVSATSVVISNQSGTVTTVTPASGYEKAMYVALPTTATTLKFLVTGSDNTKYFNMASGFTLGANYYQSPVKLATVGNVIAANGKCYKDKTAATGAGTTAVAMITYLGNDAETSTTYRNGLALALADCYSSGYTFTWCSQSSVTCLTNQYNTSTLAKTDIAGIANTDALVNQNKHAHNAAQRARNYEYSVTHPTGTSEWFLPSFGQWYKMITVKGYYNNDNYNVLCSSFSSVGGTNMASQNYWSSTEFDKYYAWRSYYNGTTSDSRPSKGNANRVRASLAF